MKPLINITRLKGVERQLERIADVLEAIAAQAYGLSFATEQQQNEEDESRVNYTDQDVIEELERMEKEGKSDEEIKRRLQLIHDARNT